MKKFSILPIHAAIFMSLIFALAAPPELADATSEPMKDIEKLIPPRTSVCFFDGEQMEDLALNSRGKITFLYVDDKLADALARQRKLESRYGSFSSVPPQVFAYATKAKSKKRHVLFIARIQALKAWRFDSSMISVGSYTPSKEDIITGISDNPTLELRHGTRELPKGYDGFIGFLVLADKVKPETEMAIGYGGDKIAWSPPAKNQ